MMKATLQKNWWTLWLYFLLGFASTMSQAFLLREFLYLYHGSELYLGLVFAAWLFWIGLGAEIGGRLALRLTCPARWFGLGLMIAAMMLSLQILFLRSARLWLHLSAGLNLGTGHVLLVTVIALIPAALLPGLLFPVVLRVGGRADEPKEVATLYMAESVGSLVAGVLFSYLLVTLLGAMISASLLFILLSNTGLLVLISAYRRQVVDSSTVPRALSPTLPCIFLLIFLDLCGLMIGVKLEKQTILTRWNALKTGSILIGSHDSKYQNVCLSSSGDQYNVFSDGHYEFAFPDLYQSAVNAALLLSQPRNPQSILVIGDGMEDLIMQMLSTRVEQIEWVQRDPAMAHWLNPYLSEDTRAALRSQRLHKIFTDGRRFVHQTHRQYDLIYVHASDPSSALANRYYTRDFFTCCSKLLRPSGVFSTRMMLTEGYLGQEMGIVGGTIYHTLVSVFPSVSLCPGDNTILFASHDRHLLTDEADVLWKRLSQRLDPNQKTDILPDVLYSFYLPEHVSEVLARLKEWSRVPLNTDLRPTAYFHYVRLADRLTGEQLLKTERLLRPHRWAVLLAAVLLVFSGGILIHRRRPRLKDAATLVSAFISGFAAMALELVVLIYYQTKFGYLYQMIGFLVAAFMVGLALGGFLARRILDCSHTWVSWVAGILFGAALFSFGLPGILEGLWHLSTCMGVLSEFCFPLLLLLSGGLTGVGLPLLVVLLAQSERDLSRSTGRISRADNLGGALGALTGGAFLLPVLGLVGTCRIVSITLIFASLLLFSVRKRYNY